MPSAQRELRRRRGVQGSSRGQGGAGAAHKRQGGGAHCASVRRERVSCFDRRPMKLGRPEVEQVLSSLQSLLKEVRREERDSVLRQGARRVSLWPELL